MGGHETGDAGPSERPDVRVMRDADRSDAWILVADGTPQSHVDLSDPTYLDFEYVRRLAHVADLTAPEGAPIAALHLGAGALTLPRYIAATRPGSRQRAVDDNPELVERVRSELPWGGNCASGSVSRTRAPGWRSARRRVPTCSCATSSRARAPRPP